MTKHWWAKSDDAKICRRRRHVSHEAALTALHAIQQQGFGINTYAEKLRPVACKTCGGWHLVKK